MKILMSCGQTGGHVKNAINLARYLKDNSHIKKSDIIFVIPENSQFDIILKKDNFISYTIPVGKTPTSLSFAYIVFSAKMIISLIKSMIILNKVKPEIIIGFGSYSSLPVILASILIARKIPVILHEQNVVAGKANKFLAKFADKVAVSFEETKKYFSQKSCLVGNPVNEKLINLRRNETSEIIGLEKDKFTILITGGSQGSVFINRLMIEVIKILPEEIKDNIQLIHLTGLNNYKWVRDNYQDIGFRQFKLYSFMDKIEYALARCDLVISRAGAMTISEIMTFGKPSILIPYPFAGGHQRKNAEYLKNNRAALVFEQKSVNTEKIKNVLLHLITDRDKLNKMAESVKNLAIRDTNRRFSDLIFEIYENKYRISKR